MVVHDLKSTRKVSLVVLLITIELVIIAAFGGGWTSGVYYDATVGTHTDVPGTSPPYSNILPYPSYADWWFGLTAIVMYLVLVICFLYISWTVFQIVLPDAIPFDLKLIVLIDSLFSLLLTSMLIFAYSFFAGGFNGKTYLHGLHKGYCFWFAVVSSISSFFVFLISGLSWYKNS